MIIAPVKDILAKIGEVLLNEYSILIIRRVIPYPPSFRRIAASTIDPAMGASTCAFGNHRCTENIGSFTRNPLIRNSIIMELNEMGVNRVIIIMWSDWELR